jgi:predicted DNA-binding transcriptional regulator YafY
MVQTLNGYDLPATVDHRTDLNDLPIAASVYMRLSGGTVAPETIFNTFDAMRDANAIVALYADGNGIEARVIWPDRISLTSDNHLTCHGYCTLRREYRTFRLDRMIGCHPLSTPDDDEGAEKARRVIAEEFDHERWQQSQAVTDVTAPNGQPF